VAVAFALALAFALAVAFAVAVAVVFAVASKRRHADDPIRIVILNPAFG
jgi:hypothetical protein